MTNLGVTKKVYDEWTGRESTEQEMRDLTPEDVGSDIQKELLGSSQRRFTSIWVRLGAVSIGV